MPQSSAPARSIRSKWCSKTRSAASTTASRGARCATSRAWASSGTLKFVCELATSSGESFKDGSEFYLWISDDLNKIPLYLESPIRIGSVRVRLLDASNLKYPLTSKIK
ncbi:MAG: DUF3108 domain-containing protein [Alistipes indistinctus]